MDISTSKVFKVLDPKRIWIPILLGVSIVFFLFYNDSEVTLENFKIIFDANIGGILMAFLMLLIRDAGYVYRIRTLTNQELNWKSSIIVIILWEFASAVTPSVVGGTAVVVFVLTMEGIKFGKSLAYVMLTAILDNMFFVLAAPVVMLFTDQVFPTISGEYEKSARYFFYLSYGLIAIYTLIMSYGLFVRPRAFKWFLLKVTAIKYFKRWREKANQYGDEIILASGELIGKQKRYWIKICLATVFIWCARYLMVNALVGAYEIHDFANHFVIFSRNIIMWIVMLVSPTPGSAGFAEYFFEPFFQEFLGRYTIITAILWRVMSFYPYLLLGAIFLPRWVKSRFFDAQKEA